MGERPRTYPKLPVLPVRQVQEFLIGPMLKTDRIPVPPLVLQDIHGSQNNRQGYGDQRRHHDGDLGRYVIGRVLGLEGFRADDVAETEAHQQDGVHGDFLRVAGEVGRHPGVDERQGRADAVGHIVADELAGFGVRWEECHKAAADHAGREEDDDKQPSLVEVAGGPGGADYGDDGDGTGGDGQERRLFGGVAEPSIPSDEAGKCECWKVVTYCLMMVAW